MDEKDRLEILKDILFTDDREYAEKIAKRIELLEQTVNERKKLSSKVDPIIEHQLSEFTKSIPSTLGPTITATLKQEIKNHKDEVVDALFPILGKMVKKYVAQEMKVLSEKINRQLRFKFSLKGLKRKFKSWFGNVKEEELLLSELSSAQIEQVLLIERGSGILTASYARTKTIDEEMVSGMLTAIKTFVEDAFGQKNQNLELIEYELYQIHLQSFVGYYIAVVISGNYTLKSKNLVQDIIFSFYNDFMAMKNVGTINKEVLQKELELNFGDASI